MRPDRATADPIEALAPDADADDGPPTSRWRLRRPQRSDWPLLVGLIAVCIPAIRMTRMVRDGSRMQYNDYWPMITQVLQPDGGIDIGGVFKFRNEHPIAIPKVLYWVNARVFHGSNITQGLLVVAIVLATVALVAVIARRTPSMDRWTRIAVVVAASFAYFSFRGSWYFVKGMSGTAWLTSYFFVVAAFAAHARGRRFLPIVFGVLACISYGTGLAVWPALLAVAALRDRNIVRQWPIALTGTVVLWWYWVRYQEVKQPRNPFFPAPGIVEGTKSSLATIGTFVRFDDDNATVMIGAAILLVGVAAAMFVAWRIWTDPPTVDHAGATAWIGLFLVAGLTAALVSSRRYSWFLPYTGGRYSIVGSALCVAVLGLVFTALPLLPRLPRPAGRVVAAAGFTVVMIIALGGQFAADELQRSKASQSTLQVAMRLDLASGSAFWDGGFDEIPVGIEDLLRATGQIPFDDAGALSCGRIGNALADDALSPDTPLSGQVTRSPPSTSIVGAELITGFIDTDGAKVDCMVVIGDTGRVRGAGELGVPADGFGIESEHRDGRLWFILVAQQAEVLDVWYRLEGESTFHELPG